MIVEKIKTEANPIRGNMAQTMDGNACQKTKRRTLEARVLRRLTQKRRCGHMAVSEYVYNTPPGEWSRVLQNLLTPEEKTRYRALFAKREWCKSPQGRAARWLSKARKRGKFASFLELNQAVREAILPRLKPNEIAAIDEEILRREREEAGRRIVTCHEWARRGAEAIAQRKAEEEERAAVTKRLGGDLDKGMCSGIPSTELKRYGYSEDQCKQIAKMRREAMRLTAAATFLGISKGCLDRWCKLEWIKPSFHCVTYIWGAGRINARHWTKSDLVQIKRRLPDLMRKEAERRAAPRKTAVKKSR